MHRYNQIETNFSKSLYSILHFETQSLSLSHYRSLSSLDVAVFGFQPSVCLTTATADCTMGWVRVSDAYRIPFAMRNDKISMKTAPVVIVHSSLSLSLTRSVVVCVSLALKSEILLRWHEQFPRACSRIDSYAHGLVVALVLLLWRWWLLCLRNNFRRRHSSCCLHSPVMCECFMQYRLLRIFHIRCVQRFVENLLYHT